tara:strand:- start:123 stop:713 length:591 start_codon:yes stop_codon:yes gene_type:complete
MKQIDPGISWLESDATFPASPIPHGAVAQAIWPIVADTMQIACLWAVPPMLSMNLPGLSTQLMDESFSGAGYPPGYAHKFQKWFHFPLNPLKDRFKVWVSCSGNGTVLIDQLTHMAAFDTETTTQIVVGAGSSEEETLGPAFASIQEGPVMTSTHATEANHFVESIRIGVDSDEMRIWGVAIECIRGSLTLPSSVT